MNCQARRLNNPRHIKFIAMVQLGCEATEAQILALLDDCNLLENDEYDFETAAEEAIQILQDPEYWAMVERENSRASALLSQEGERIDW